MEYINSFYLVNKWSKKEEYVYCFKTETYEGKVFDSKLDDPMSKLYAIRYTNHRPLWGPEQKTWIEDLNKNKVEFSKEDIQLAKEWEMWLDEFTKRLEYQKDPLGEFFKDGKATVMTIRGKDKEGNVLDTRKTVIYTKNDICIKIPDELIENGSIKII